MRSSLFTLLLLVSSVDGSLPTHRFRRFHFGFGFGKGKSSDATTTTSSAHEDEYDYYDTDDDDDTNHMSLKDLNMVKVASGITCASLIGCGILYQFGVFQIPKFPSIPWLNRLVVRRSNKQVEVAAEDEESMNKVIEKNVHQERNEGDSISQDIEKSDETSSSSIRSASQEEEEESRDIGGIAGALGPHLLKVCSNGTRLESVNTTQALKGKVIGLYFSSLEVEKEMKHRNLTRLMLAQHVDMVRQLSVKSGKPLELVYVSLDDNARSFRDMVRALKVSHEENSGDNISVEVLDDDDEESEYESGSAWLAVPFSEKDIITKLNEKFIPAEGPPQIVMVDVDSGLILNRGALSQLLANPMNYPWKSPTPLQILLGKKEEKDRSKEKEETEAGCSVVLPQSDKVLSAREATHQSKYIGLYFSADWCTPCKTFMPLLSQTYATVNSATKTKKKHDDPFITSSHLLEIVYVSLDRSEKNFTQYRNQMPWPAVVFEGRSRAELEQALGVRALPSLVIFNKETGEIITRDGRSAVMEDPHAINFPWDESAVTELAPLTTASSTTASSSTRKYSQQTRSTYGKKKKSKSLPDADADDADDDDDDEGGMEEDETSPPSPPSDNQAVSQPPPKGLIDGISLVVFIDTLPLQTKSKTISALKRVASNYVEHVALNANLLFSSKASQNQQVDETPTSSLMSFISNFRLSFFSANGRSPIVDAVRALIGQDINTQGRGKIEGQKGHEDGNAIFADLKTKSKSTTSQTPLAVILDIPNRRYFKLELGHLQVGKKEEIVVMDESMLEQFVFDVFAGKVPARPLAVNLDTAKK